MKRIAILAASLLACSAPALAEIKAQNDNGFNAVHIAEVAATPDELWKRLLSPKDYWSKEHSWSGSAAGFYIDPQAGGCFCELMQDKQAVGKQTNTSRPTNSGSVEHMRVIFAHPGKVLRMQGALGPLQSEAVLGTLTVAMQPVATPAGSKPLTKLSFSYVVGGYMRYKVSEIAPAVDKVIGEQFASLIKPFGKTAAIEDKASNWSLDLGGLGESEAGSDAGAKPATEVETPDAPASDSNESAVDGALPKDKFIKEDAKKPGSAKKER